MDYNSARMDLLDYRYDLLDYNAYGQELKENGISENDAIIYLTWQFGDDNVLNTEALKSIVETGNKKKVDISLIKAFAADIFKECFRISPLIISLIFIYVILILRCRNNPLEGSFVFTFVAASILLLAGILFYYEYSGRFSHRIVYALFICIFTFGIMVLSDSDNIPEENVDIDSSGIIVVISICVFLNIGLLLGNRFDYEAYKREMPDYKGVFSEMDNNRDKLFVADTFTFQEAYKYDVFKSFGLGSLDNFVAVGSWYVNSPITRSILSQYGYSNPYEALGENDVNVVLVDNCYPEEKAKFLGEHYNGDYFAEELTDCFEADYGFNYYRMVH